jgi:hypothetical protein
MAYRYGRTAFALHGRMDYFFDTQDTAMEWGMNTKYVFDFIFDLLCFVI